MHELRIGVCYDFRNPPDSGVADRMLYEEILDQVRWLDRIGADLVWFTEHHFIEDGYLPSWVPVGCEFLFNASKRAKIGIRASHVMRMGIVVSGEMRSPAKPPLDSGLCGTMRRMAESMSTDSVKKCHSAIIRQSSLMPPHPITTYEGV